MSAHRMHLSAINAYNTAYAKYSNFRVGASVLCMDQVFSGCNIENASYGATVCAERVAIWKAISELGPDVKIDKLCLVTKNGDVPCGNCLQVMSEFMSPDAEVFLCSVTEVKSTKKFKELMPFTFEL
jgi:cytidine deaminase